MTRLTYTADIGRYNSSLLKDPSPFPQSDLIICESTYGNRTHEPIDNASQQLLNAVINTCSNKGGKLIIPAFSLGRTQELIYTLNKLNLYGLLPEIKIYIDSPLSISATEITKKHVSLLNDSVLEYAHLHDPFGFEKLTYIQTKEESQALNKSDEPCVIISASGMAEAGRVKHHISFAIESHKNTILLVGYAEPTSLAGRLRSGEKLVKIFGQEHNVNAEILTIESLSAHADKNEIIKYLSCQNVNSVRNVFLVHGENDARESLKIMLKKNGFQKVTLPEMGSVYKY
jgi:metallo-beta-lactamase family protein